MPIDERGRGGTIPAMIEDICIQRLAAAILETAVADRVMLEELGHDQYYLPGNIHIATTEIEAFARSNIGSILLDEVSPNIVNLDRARLIGKARAKTKRGKGGKPPKLMPFHGEELSADEWSKRTGMTVFTVYDRWDRYGKNGDADWLDPTIHRSGRNYMFNWDGKVLSLREICELEGVNKQSIYPRIHQGMTIHEAVAAAKGRKRSGINVRA